MAKHRPDQPEGSDHGHEHDSDRDEGHKFENDKGNASHIEIEERRFRGGLTPTPDLYARAREQWNQLPGSVVRPPTDPVPGNPPAAPETKPEPPAESNDDK
jgi:hypothetical protein